MSILNRSIRVKHPVSRKMSKEMASTTCLPNILNLIFNLILYPKLRCFHAHGRNHDNTGLSIKKKKPTITIFSLRVKALVVS